MRARLHLIGEMTLARYALASIVALGADTALFLLLSGGLIPPAIAAIAGYVTGMAVHWALSVRHVFRSGTDTPMTHRHRAGFIMSALVGLAVTVAVVSALTMTGISAPVAKAVAVTVSFALVYLVRKHVVFAVRA